MDPAPDGAADTSAAGSSDAADSRTADRSDLGQPTKVVLSRVEHLRTAVRQLVAEPSRLRTEVQERHAELRARAVAQQLQAMPLDRLRAGATTGLRLGNLEKAGLRTVHDALNADPTSLQEHDGIGPKTADEVGRAARKIADAAERDVSVRLDPDRRDAVQTRLLRTLRALRVATDAVEIPELEGLLAWTRP